MNGQKFKVFQVCFWDNTGELHTHLREVGMVTNNTGAAIGISSLINLFYIPARHPSQLMLITQEDKKGDAVSSMGVIYPDGTWKDAWSYYGDNGPWPMFPDFGTELFLREIERQGRIANILPEIPDEPTTPILYRKNGKGEEQKWQ